LQRSQLEKLSKAISYMEKNFSNPLTLKKVSQIAHMSPSYFSKFFHKTLQIRYIDYLKALRLQAAKKLLETTQDTVLDIAFRCGFNNMSYFYRSYKKAFGEAPRVRHHNANTEQKIFTKEFTV